MQTQLQKYLSKVRLTSEMVSHIALVFFSVCVFVFTAFDTSYLTLGADLSMLVHKSTSTLFWRPYFGASSPSFLGAYLSEHGREQVYDLENIEGKRRDGPKGVKEVPTLNEGEGDDGVCLIDKPCTEKDEESSTEEASILIKKDEARSLRDAAVAAAAAIDLGNALFEKVLRWRESILLDSNESPGSMLLEETANFYVTAFEANETGHQINEGKEIRKAKSLRERAEHVQHKQLGFYSPGKHDEINSVDADKAPPPTVLRKLLAIPAGSSSITSSISALQEKALVEADDILSASNYGVLTKMLLKSQVLAKTSKAVLEVAMAGLRPKSGGGQNDYTMISKNLFADATDRRIPTSPVLDAATQKDPTARSKNKSPYIDPHKNDKRYHHKPFAVNHDFPSSSKNTIADLSQALSNTALSMEGTDSNPAHDYSSLLAGKRSAGGGSTNKVGTIGDIGGFMKNAADKLRYQLDNWEPIMTVRMGRPNEGTQWNPIPYVSQREDGAESSKPTALQQQPLIIIGLCTVQRKRAQYLENTIHSLLEAEGRLSDKELWGSSDDAGRGNIRVVVYNAHSPPEANQEVAQVRRRYEKHIARGILTIIDRSDPSYRQGPPTTSQHQQRREGNDPSDPFNPFARYYQPTTRSTSHGSGASLATNWHTADDEYTQKYNWLSQPQLSGEVARRWGDSEDRLRWRSKQSLDAAYLMDYVAAAHRHVYEEQSDGRVSTRNFFDSLEQGAAGSYFLMLEDDVDATKHYIQKLRRWLNEILLQSKTRSDYSSSSATQWTVASFYNPWEDAFDGQALPPNKFFGMIGQLVRVSDLPCIASFIRKNFDQSPLDWLMVDFLKKFGGTMVVHTPSLFEHLGVQSSLEGKEQPAKAADFVKE